MRRLRKRRTNPLAEWQRYRPVTLPEESWGVCRIRRCAVVGDLANGLCAYHWDHTDASVNTMEKGQHQDG